MHGRQRFLPDEPRFAEVADKFVEFIQGAELIAHNAAFDEVFQRRTGEDGPRPLSEFCEAITDSLLHARSLFPGKRNSLTLPAIASVISNAHRTLHGALLDSQLLAEVWLAMTRGQDALLIDVDDNDGARAATASCWRSLTLPV